MVEPLDNGAVDLARSEALADLELSLLLEAILRSSGHDFTEYARPTLKRRVAERMRAENAATISALQDKVLHDADALGRFVFAMTGGRRRLFYDAAFFQAFRLRIVPLLRTYAYARIWIPNCACGEDAYSLAAILREESLLDRAMIYATDESDLAITAARSGQFEFQPVDDPVVAYRAAGGTTNLAEIADISERSLRFHDDVKRHIIFARHSLITDGSINEFQVIVARAVLHQFKPALQFRVHNLFLSSLMRLGFLCLGSSENLKLTPHEGVFRQLAPDAPIYRRMR